MHFVIHADAGAFSEKIIFTKYLYYGKFQKTQQI
ncbi:MAG: hypothetical protein JWR09_750 [Mucilaginibacter sp.]|jgi:hypothetical protein|nr:hypothetical protein [Mucilaginibacter sp.]